MGKGTLFPLSYRFPIDTLLVGLLSFLSISAPLPNRSSTFFIAIEVVLASALLRPDSLPW